MADQDKHANDECVNATSATAATAVPPEIFPSALDEEKAEAKDRQGALRAARPDRAPPAAARQGIGLAAHPARTNAPLSERGVSGPIARR